MKGEFIDSEAGAYARYRLVRAVLASVFAALVVALLAIPFFVGYASLGEAVAQTLVSLLICISLFSLIATAFERLNREVTGVIGFGVFALACGAALLAMLAGVMSFLPFATPVSGGLVVGAAVFVLMVPTLWLTFDCMVFFGWQLVATDAGMQAVRGWRPKPWNLLANFERQLGLPAFIAKFRGGVLITLTYLCAALLNVGLVALPMLPTWVVPANSEQLMRGEGLGLVLALAGFLVLNALGLNRAVTALADAQAKRRYQVVREWDGRAPVLFLRTFLQDVRRAPVKSANRLLGWLTGVGRARTMDEILLEHASPYGPVIAIGDPNDPIPPLGAARIFVSHDDWRGVVAGLAASAKAVVMCPTQSEGVRWELDHIVSTGAQAHTIYLASAHLAPGETAGLFASIAGVASLDCGDGVAMALFNDPSRGWRVLTARAVTVQAYTVALNMALQALFGRDGVVMKHAPRHVDLPA